MGPRCIFLGIRFLKFDLIPREITRVLAQADIIKYHKLGGLQKHFLVLEVGSHIRVLASMVEFW